MGKKKQASASLGKRLLKDRFGPRRVQGDSFLHTSELNDGFEWQKYNAKSVTEESSLEAFLNTAQLAGTEFNAERLNITIVASTQNRGLLSAAEESKMRAVQDEHKDLLRIPRRPRWDDSTTPEQLDRMEKDAFLDWRRRLAELQEQEHILMTPFERNIEFWRQLWRVIERSDIVVQIVDARNPLLFRSEDLDSYVKEVDSEKMTMVLINKADYLSEKQREYWAKYFDQQNIRVAFWSAVEEAKRIKELEGEDSEDESDEDDDEDSESSDSGEESYEDEDDDSSNVMQTVQPHNSEPDNDAAAEHADNAASSLSDDSSNIMQAVQPHNSEPDNDAAAEHADNAASSLSDDSSNIMQAVQPHNSEPDNDVAAEHADNAASSLSDREQTLCGDGASQSNISVTESVRAENAVGISVNNRDKATELPESQDVMSSVHDTVEISVNHNESSASSDSGPTVQGCHGNNSTQMLTGDELIELFRTMHSGPKTTEGITTVGLVGYPNVGKSSSINSILQCKKVPVSATPGRTKHFQTLMVDKDVMLCDCPGLVMPSFVATKAEMVLNGILPIDQMRDYVPPAALLCQHIKRSVLEATYGIMLPTPAEDEDPHRPPTAYELLSSYGLMRGFMSHKGIPDYHRASRCILKDYVKGKLLYCLPPPDVSHEDFVSCAVPQRPLKLKEEPTLQKLPKGAKAQRKFKNEVDREFFTQVEPRIGSKGVSGKTGYTGHVADGQSEGGSLHSSMTSLAEKPWKRHGNRGKKEKLRRKFAQLDVLS